jgi:hypothetical protein
MDVLRTTWQSSFSRNPFLDNHTLTHKRPSQGNHAKRTREIGETYTHLELPAHSLPILRRRNNACSALPLIVILFVYFVLYMGGTCVLFNSMGGGTTHSRPLFASRTARCFLFGFGFCLPFVDGTIATPTPTALPKSNFDCTMRMRPPHLCVCVCVNRFLCIRARSYPRAHGRVLVHFLPLAISVAAPSGILRAATISAPVAKEHHLLVHSTVARAPLRTTTTT